MDAEGTDPVEVGPEGRAQAQALAAVARQVAAELPFGAEPAALAVALERQAADQGEPA